MTTQQPEQEIGFIEKVEHFYNQYRNYILTIIGIIAIGVLYLYYQKSQTVKKEKEAEGIIIPAQNYFRIDSLNLALYGDGQQIGFVDIADEYSGTSTGNLANYYAGICFLKIGQYEDAVDYLKDFSTSGPLVQANAYKALGDAYSELGDTDKAKHNYILASETVDIKEYTPKFLRIAADYCRYTGDGDKAIELYQKIKNYYPKSLEAQNIDALIKLSGSNEE